MKKLNEFLSVRYKPNVSITDDDTEDLRLTQAAFW